jgi:hypothetical protein
VDVLEGTREESNTAFEGILIDESLYMHMRMHHDINA